MYGLARNVRISPGIALFVSFLFLFAPVVLAQTIVNCTDLITAVFFLTSLYCAILFYKNGRILYFYATAVAAGLLWGMKYNQVFFVLSLIPFLWESGTS